MSNVSVAMWTCPDSVVAEKLSIGLTHDGLAAWVNVLL
jgi:hypothetical protein